MKKVFTLLTVMIAALQLITANAEITTPVAYDATDVTNHTMTAHWSACPGAISYTLRTYPIQLEGLVFREKFSDITANDTFEADDEGYVGLGDNADNMGWYGRYLQATDGGIVINNGGYLNLSGSETNLRIYPYVKKYTIVFKVKAYGNDTNCKLRCSPGGTTNDVVLDLGPEETTYTMVIDRDTEAYGHNYQAMLYAGFMFQNMTYEPGNNRVVVSEIKFYWGDYSEPQAQTELSPKDLAIDWSGDTTYIKNIPADSTSLSFVPGTITYHFISNFSYWHYDVKAIYADGQESDWSNQITYTVSPWPEFLEDVDDDDPTVIAGDVNGDGEVTAADITALYTYLLTGDMSDIVNGDQDNDGEITTHDVTTVYEILLGA